MARESGLPAAATRSVHDRPNATRCDRREETESQAVALF